MSQSAEPDADPKDSPYFPEVDIKTPGPPPKVPINLRLLTVADYTLSCVLLAPLVVTYWRASWYLFDVYLLPNDPAGSAWTSLAVGIAVQTLLSVFQDVFRRYIRKDNKVVWLVTCKVYAYVAGVTAICYWRGVWMLWDIFTGVGRTSALVSTGLGWGALVLLRSLINVMTTPLSLSLDTSDNYFDCSTRFRTNPSKNKLGYILDTLLTTIIIVVLVVSLWRGLWTVQNQLVYPADLARSAKVSMALGYGCVLVALTFQYSAQSSSEAMAKDFPYVMRIALHDVLGTIATIGVVSAWRGIWVYMDVWLTNTPPLDVLWTNHVVCIILLLLLHVGKSVCGQGCMLDGQAAHFPVFYLRYFFRNRFYQDNGDKKDVSVAGVSSHKRSPRKEYKRMGREMDTIEEPGAVEQ